MRWQATGRGGITTARGHRNRREARRRTAGRQIKSQQHDCHHTGFARVTEKIGGEGGKKIAEVRRDCLSPSGKPLQNMCEVFPQKSGKTSHLFCNTHFQPAARVPPAYPAPGRTGRREGSGEGGASASPVPTTPAPLKWRRGWCSTRCRRRRSSANRGRLRRGRGGRRCRPRPCGRGDRLCRRRRSRRSVRR